jgi:hypothetical protein
MMTNYARGVVYDAVFRPFGEVERVRQQSPCPL